MNLLLDTCTILWYVTASSSLSTNAKALIADPENQSHVLASIWEMAIKSKTGKLEIPMPFGEFIDETLLRNNITILVIASHLKRVAELPLMHRDPFDRLLIAQSQVEDLPIITSDIAFDSYPIQRIW